MRKNEIIYNGELTGTVSEAREKHQQNNPNQTVEFAEEFAPIQQVWRINPADEEDYKGTIGYKDA